jgi:hypothetical protein
MSRKDIRRRLGGTRKATPEQDQYQLREEIRIKDVRMAQIDPKRRPHYPLR